MHVFIIKIKKIGGVKSKTNVKNGNRQLYNVKILCMQKDTEFYLVRFIEIIQNLF